MPDVWLPGAHRDPGRNAGYNSGRSHMVRAVAHYTVGSDSRNVGRDGYFHWLVHRDASREGGCTQYAEVDAITWHAADAGNPYGPGIEWERNTTGGMNGEGLSNAEPLTANQVEWGARIIEFCAEWGITPALYDGPRYGAGGWHGWVNHQAIDSSRSDGLLRAEWDSMTTTEEAEEEEMPSYACAMYQNEMSQIFVTDGIVKRYLPDGNQLNVVVNCGLCNPAVYFLPEVYLAGIPWDADDPFNPATRGAGAVLPPTKGATKAPPGAFDDAEEPPRRDDE